jgi:broad specificity phosphatase PhoE
MRLIFVRHAESEANAEGRLRGGGAEFGLSDEGRAQAGKLSESFKRDGLQPTHLYSSPLVRAAATAEILARSWSVPVAYWEDLKEHDIGVLSGLTWEEAIERYPGIDPETEKARQLTGVEGAESLADRRSRARRVIEETLRRHANGDVVLLVTHGGILTHIVSELLGTPRSWGLSVQNTAVFDFTLDAERWSLDGDALLDPSLWRIARFNDVSHLELPLNPGIRS